MKLIYRKASPCDIQDIANLVTILLGTCDVEKPLLRGGGERERTLLLKLFSIEIKGK